jgi:hypothetical protein
MWYPQYNNKISAEEVWLCTLATREEVAAKPEEAAEAGALTCRCIYCNPRRKEIVPTDGLFSFLKNSYTDPFADN